MIAPTSPLVLTSFHLTATRGRPRRRDCRSGPRPSRAGAYSPACASRRCWAPVGRDDDLERGPTALGGVRAMGGGARARRLLSLAGRVALEALGRRAAACASRRCARAGRRRLDPARSSSRRASTMALSRSSRRASGPVASPPSTGRSRRPRSTFRGPGLLASVDMDEWRWRGSDVLALELVRRRARVRLRASRPPRGVSPHAEQAGSPRSCSRVPPQGASGT